MESNPGIIQKIGTYIQQHTGLVVGISVGIIVLIIVIIVVIMSILKSPNPDPCADMPHKSWDSIQKKCVPDSCANNGKFCSTDKSCRPENYCDYTNPGTNWTYEWDAETCKCKLSCTQYPNAISNPPNTAMILNEMYNTYEPVDQLICGTPCYLKEDTGYCISSDNHDNYCGSIKYYRDGQYFVEAKGCFSSLEYEDCGNSPDSIGAGIVCKWSEGGCVDDAAGARSCNVSSYCGEFEDPVTGLRDVLACTSDAECMGENAHCTGVIKTGEANSKHFKKVGYCEGTISNPATHPNCLPMNKIGEDGSESNPEIVSCENLDQGQAIVVGISKLNAQCIGTGALIRNPSGGGDLPCTTYGICANNWQAKPNDDGSYCSPDSTIPGELSAGNCCKSNHQAEAPDGSKFCCIEAGNDKCLNTTLNPYSDKMLNQTTSTNDVNVTLDCPPLATRAAEITGLNEKLWATLGISAEDGANDPESSSYTGFYCGKLENGEEANKLYAYCGAQYTMHGSETTKFVTLDSCSERRDPDQCSGNLGYSFCMKKDEEACALTPQGYEHGEMKLGANNEYTVPYCKIGGSGDTKYWSAGEMVTGLSTNYIARISNPETCQKATLAVCASNATMLNNPWVVSAEEITTPVAGCSYKINCDDMKISLPIIDDSTSNTQHRMVRLNQLNDTAQYIGGNGSLDYEKIFVKSEYGGSKIDGGDNSGIWCTNDDECIKNKHGFPDNMVVTTPVLDGTSVNDGCLTPCQDSGMGNGSKICSAWDWDGTCALSSNRINSLSYDGIVKEGQ